MKRRTRLVAFAGVLLLAAALAVVPRIASAQGIQVQTYSIVGAQFGLCLTYDFDGRNVVSGLSGCPNTGGALWIIERDRLLDLSRSRCLTLQDDGDIELTPCHPRSGDQREWWSVGAAGPGTSTVIANLRVALLLQENPVPSVGEAGDRWLVREAGVIEYPDNPTG